MVTFASLRSRCSQDSLVGSRQCFPSAFMVSHFGLFVSPQLLASPDLVRPRAQTRWASKVLKGCSFAFSVFWEAHAIALAIQLTFPIKTQYFDTWQWDSSSSEAALSSSTLAKSFNFVFVSKSLVAGVCSARTKAPVVIGRCVGFPAQSLSINGPVQ